MLKQRRDRYVCRPRSTDGFLRTSPGPDHRKSLHRTPAIEAARCDFAAAGEARHRTPAGVASTIPARVSTGKWTPATVRLIAIRSACRINWIKVGSPLSISSSDLAFDQGVDHGAAANDSPRRVSRSAGTRARKVRIIGWICGNTRPGAGKPARASPHFDDGSLPAGRAKEARTSDGCGPIQEADWPRKLRILCSCAPFPSSLHAGAAYVDPFQLVDEVRLKGADHVHERVGARPGPVAILHGSGIGGHVIENSGQ